LIAMPRFARFRSVFALFLIVALAGCETTGAGRGFALDGGQAAPLTAEEQQLRADAELFNRTVLGGAVTKAAIWGGVGALATLILTGDVEQAAKVGAVGLLAGGIVGAIDGYMVAVQQEAANQQVREIEIHIARVEEENARLQESIDTTQRVIESTERRIAEAEARARADATAVADLEAERARAERNLAQIDRLITGAEKRRDEHLQVAQAVARQGEDTRSLDAEIARSSARLERLRRERDVLATQIDGLSIA
jgi:DNA repair exonuclease SbcCD ATPase subunit